MAEESVKVAVRVRPFNSREKERQSKLTINMSGATTVITNPENKSDEKKFTFDFSYWSHDGFKELDNGYLEPSSPSSRYASQALVFDDLGQGVLANAIEGFNCSLFAYGQTGSGKSYSMVGYGNNKGIVPLTCDELFNIIKRETNDTKRFCVTFSMLEIYNENVRDLLNKESPKGGLPVREHVTAGFYVQGLKKVPVGSYQEIEKRMEQGTANRTVAATNMNATSSRAHTVVTISFDQIIKTDTGETKKSSEMNLVDLAGSERADSTGATGDRLKEGANINRSLSSLGNVISALADRSMGKKKVQVPYRDSVLTKLLKNALGGNSKTVMIAALSPADINYDETLSTLRYADRAKKIKNTAIVNENPLDKLIRELREENEKLKKALASGGISGDVQGDPEEIAKMRQQMEEEIRAKLLANSDSLQMWQSEEAQREKIDAARAETEVEDKAKAVSDKKRKKVAHLTNLNEDPMLSGVVLIYLDNENTTIGRGDAEPPPIVALKGLSISKNHAVIQKKGKNLEIRPGTQGAKTKVNGLPLTGPRDLQHKDRILFGSNHLYVFNNPLNTECAKDLPKVIDWEFAQSEIAEAKGFQTGFGAGLSKEQQIAQEQILELLPMVTEVNAISEELDKQRTFEVVLLSAAAQEGIYGSSKSAKIMVKMKNLSNDNTWLWERGKFMNRRYMIQEIYQRYLDGEDVSKITEDRDPFWEPPEDVLIGTANIFLQSLAYCLDFDDKLPIIDYKGLEEGLVYVNLAPCNQHGRQLSEEDAFIDEPSDLLGKPYFFKVTIRMANVKKARFSRGLKVRYRVYKDNSFAETETIRGTLEPQFNHSKVFSFPSCLQEHLDFFESGCITFSVYGLQEDSSGDPKYSKMSTKEMREMERISADLQRRSSVMPTDSSEISRVKAELLTMQRKNARLEKKEKRLQSLCDEWAKKSPMERDFEAFYRAVSAVANSSGSRFRTSAGVIAKDSLCECGDVSRCNSICPSDDAFLSDSQYDQLLSAQRAANSFGSQPQARPQTSPARGRVVQGNEEKNGSGACIMM